jgi:hypothetical protein
VTVPTATALVAALGTLLIAAAATRRSRRAREPQPLLALVGVGLAGLMVIVLAASLIAPLILRPCD